MPQSMAHPSDSHHNNSWLHATAEKEPESSDNAESGLDHVKNFGLAARVELTD
jgi:hypothetical protein